MPAAEQNTNNVRIRKIEPWIVTTHAQLAEHEGISLEAHLREVLRKQALQAQKDFADVLEQRRADIAAKFGTNFTNSVELIRAVRDESEA